MDEIVDGMAVSDEHMPVCNATDQWLAANILLRLAPEFKMPEDIRVLFAKRFETPTYDFMQSIAFGRYVGSPEKDDPFESMSALVVSAFWAARAIGITAGVDLAHMQKGSVRLGKFRDDEVTIAPLDDTLTRKVQEFMTFMFSKGMAEFEDDVAAVKLMIMLDVEKEDDDIKDSFMLVIRETLNVLLESCVTYIRRSGNPRKVLPILFIMVDESLFTALVNFAKRKKAEAEAEKGVTND